MKLTHKRLWDFGGMTSLLKPFRSVTPKDGNYVNTLQFSSTGDRFIVATADSRAKIFDRDGFELSPWRKHDRTDGAGTSSSRATCTSPT